MPPRRQRTAATKKTGGSGSKNKKVSVDYLAGVLHMPQEKLKRVFDRYTSIQILSSLARVAKKALDAHPDVELLRESLEKYGTRVTRKNGMEVVAPVVTTSGVKITLAPVIGPPVISPNNLQNCFEQSIEDDEDMTDDAREKLQKSIEDVLEGLQRAKNRQTVIDDRLTCSLQPKELKDTLQFVDRITNALSVVLNPM